jgi:hypothetical protein
MNGREICPQGASPTKRRLIHTTLFQLCEAFIDAGLNDSEWLPTIKQFFERSDVRLLHSAAAVRLVVASPATSGNGESKIAQPRGWRA